MERAAHILNVTHQVAARDAASILFRPSITKTDILVMSIPDCCGYYPHMRMGKVWIYRLLFCVCLCVCLFCTVTVFSAEDKASGVKFCSAVYCATQPVAIMVINMTVSHVP